MKYAVLLLVIMSFGFKPPKTCNTKATITGFDLTKCACCWGWEIEVNGKKHIARKLPNLTVASKDTMTFPIPIYIDYKVDRGCHRMIYVSCLSYPEN